MLTSCFRIQRFGPSEIHDVAKSARSGIQNANLDREVNIKAWDGTWNHTFTSSSDDFAGKIVLRSTESGVVGEFDVKDKSIKGLVEGTLSDDASILSGTWKNSAGSSQRGNFFFHLNKDNNTWAFRGNYSTFKEPFTLGALSNKGSGNTWTGTKKVE